jgi:hypothetical protein
MTIRTEWWAAGLWAKLLSRSQLEAEMHEAYAKASRLLRNLAVHRGQDSLWQVLAHPAADHLDWLRKVSAALRASNEFMFRIERHDGIGPTTSAIDTPHDRTALHIIDDVYRARILSQAKDISSRQAQRLCQREANHASMSDNERALPAVRRDDIAYGRGDALLELPEGLATGDRLERKSLQPTRGQPGMAPGNLIPREPLPLAEMDLAQLRPHIYFQPELARDRFCGFARPLEIAGIDGAHRVARALLANQSQLLAARLTEGNIRMSLELPAALRRRVAHQQ